MRKVEHLSITVATAVFVTATAFAVDLREPRRVVGAESNIRLDASLPQQQMGPGSTVRISFTITNNSGLPIAVADPSPQPEYDPDTRTITLTIGSEIPLQRAVDKMVRIEPGGAKSFDRAARVNVYPDIHGPLPYPQFVRVKLNFLGDAQQFQQYFGQRAALAKQDLFPKWVEANQTVTSNTLPIWWGNDGRDAIAQASAGE